MTDGDGGSAPSLVTPTDEPLTDEEFNQLKEDIQNANDDLISASVKGAQCLQHSEHDTNCEDCKKIKDLVSTFNFHKCTFSCHKRKKFMKISGREGLGIKEEISDDFLTLLCRAKFPKFPLDETLLLLPISKSEDYKAVQQMHKDLRHIKSYLLRRVRFFQTNENEDSWTKFKNMTFLEFLHDLGMFEGFSMDQTEAVKERYINALRADIKGKAFIYLKRETQDILTNNFNPVLMALIRANIDLQYVFEPFSCANYMTNYVTKNESGYSHTLKRIEEEFKNLGDYEITKKFGKEIDQKREVSIQESTYRSLGLPMSKFSRKVKFINTNHPEKRDGLVRENYEDLEDNEAVFHLSVHQYYEQRPVNGNDGVDWESMCLAEIESNYERRNKPSSTTVPLLNNLGYLQRRLRPAVLRYYLRYDEPEDLARGLLILFHPFRNELIDLHSNNVLELFDDNQEAIETRRMEYEKNIHLVDLIQEIEEINEKNNEENDHDDDEGAYEDELIEDETTSEKDINKFISDMKSSAKRSVANDKETLIPTLAELSEKIIKLNENQRLIFDDVCERVFASNQFSDQFCLYIAGEVMNLCIFC